MILLDNLVCRKIMDWHLENAIEKDYALGGCYWCITEALKAIGDGVQYVKDLNKAMTDTKMVNGGY